MSDWVNICVNERMHKLKREGTGMQISEHMKPKMSECVNNQLNECKRMNEWKYEKHDLRNSWMSGNMNELIVKGTAI